VTTESAEIAVVGAGITGLAIARALRLRGADVLVVEQAGIGSGQSGIQPGGVRQQWGTAIACRLARESAAFWRDAEATLDFPVALGFRACGYLFTAHSEAALERLRANVAIQNAEGVPSRIVSPDEAAVLVPGLGTETLTGAAWCEEDGYFDRPQSVVEAFGRGAEVRIATVHALRPATPGWALDTSAGTLSAEAVVVAAGRASVELVAGLGVELPIESEERHLFVSLPIADRLLDPLVVSAERAFAAKQLGDGRMLASDLAAAGPAEEGAARWRARVQEGIRELLPRLEYVDFPILASGAYDITPDRQPILGAIPGHEGLYLAAGFSGHGFMIAPAVGRILADAVDGRHDPILDVLDAARFAEGRPVHEPQVV
jgi:glycine/D-amino acid oxidase-like deaminating enzyme